MSQAPRRRNPSPAKARSRPKLRNQILFVLGIIVLSAGAFYTALVVATQIDRIFFPGSEINLGGSLAKLPGIDRGGGDSSSDVTGGRINILVMGLDRRPYEGNAATRTDTMFVVTVDASTKTARGLAMPRDLYVDIPTKSGGSFKDRINTAYVFGGVQNYPGGSPALAKATVERLLGIKVNYYVVIDFEGFKQVIDLLGGIDVDVPTLLSDPFYSETELLGDYYPCVFQPGQHHMNGSDALCYSRVRRNSSDLDRIQRQQRVIFAVMDKATQLKVLSDPTNALNLWKRYKTTVQTDISDALLPGFVKLAAAIDTDHLAFLSLGAATVPWTTPEGAAVLIPSEAGIKQIVDALYSDQKLQQEAALVEVQNGTDRAGQAAKAVEYLSGLGMPSASLKTANASDTSRVRTEIIDFGGKRYTAERIAAWLGVPKDRVRHGGEVDASLRSIAAADIVVILGSDAKIESTAAIPPAR